MKIKKVLASCLIVIAFIIAIIEALLDIVTFTLYSKITRKKGIKDMYGFKILVYAGSLY